GRGVARHSAAAPPAMSCPYQGATKASVSGNEALQGLAEPRGHCGPAVDRLAVGPALGAETAAPLAVLEQDVERLRELVEVLEGQPTRRLEDVMRRHRASRVHEDRGPREPGLHEDDREGFVDR